MKTLDISKRRRSRMLAMMLNSILVIACCGMRIGWSQDSLAPPAFLGLPQIADTASGGVGSGGFDDTTEMIESDRFSTFSRTPPPMSLPQNSQFIVSEDRPEFPNADNLPAPASDRGIVTENEVAEPVTFDWSLLEPSLSFSSAGGGIQMAEPLAIIPSSEPDEGCAACGSGRLYSDSHSRGRRLSGGLLAALCPCDSCYQPRWDLQQSAAFFVDSARPQTRTRFGWDFGANMILADRAEYFWARSGSLGPAVVPEFNYHELSMYTEVAKGGFSFFTSLPYRSLYLRDAGHEAGFADMRIGTKSLVHDSPLLQIAFQMTTHIPSAQSTKGLGTAHVSLEPALLMGMRLSRTSFLQAQVAQWIPIGGDPDYAGALSRWGISWNRLAWQLDEKTQMTTNLEVFAWSFQDGAYTDPVLGPFQKASNETYVYLGPGCRLLICDKWELGVGGAFALSDRHFAESLIRSEFTMRF